jgi:hypothetical protein
VFSTFGTPKSLFYFSEYPLNKVLTLCLPPYHPLVSDIKQIKKLESSYFEEILNLAYPLLPCPVLHVKKLLFYTVDVLEVDQKE